MRKHVEAAHLGHNDIEQHERELFAMLLQQLHGLEPVHGFDNFVLVAEHFAQNHAIHLGIVDDKQKWLAEFARFKGVDVGNHTAPLVFRAIHKAIGLLHGGFDGFAVGNDAANARRKEMVIVIGQRRLRHGIAYGMMATREGFLIDIRHHEQEFVAAEANEHIGIAHASLHRARGGMQRQIARVMAQGIVHELEVVQIDNGDTCENALATQLVFVEAAVECTR